MKLCKVDPVNGLFVEDVICDAPPTLEDGCPDPTYIYAPVPPNAGFYHPRWDGDKWVEGGAAPEPVAPKPTIEERLAAVEAATLDLILGGAV